MLLRLGLRENADFDSTAIATSPEKLPRLIVFAVCSLLCAGMVARAQSKALSEAQIKAGFLFNFTKFVEWPPDAFADSEAPIELGVLGANPVTELLTVTAAGKTVNGRAVIVRSFKEGQDPRICQILFVSSSQESHLPQILERVKGLPILTVSESTGFTQSGGMINFFVEGNKVRLEINLDAAVRARLKISSKVIAVARLMNGEPSRGKP